MNFRSPSLIRKLASAIAGEAKGMEPKTLMEVCGSHTQAVARFGLRKLLPQNVRLVSGPGCPVCITPPREIGEAVWIAKRGAILTTYGDLARVPSRAGSLLDAKAEGADVRIVYSIAEAGEIARANPKKTIVHAAIGFETTAQTTAAFLNSSPPGNLLVLNCHRRFLPAMDALLASRDLKIDGYICPGHVSTLVGSDAYRFLSEKYGVSQVVAGFEPVDVMLAALMLVRQLKKGEAKVENEYTRVVRKSGNPKAIGLVRSTFGISDAEWRGLGVIRTSGMPLKGRFSKYDARKLFHPKSEGQAGMPKGCLCASVLKGKLEPSKCPLFGRACTPENPIGPCMVSVEGACHNALRYE